MSLRESKAHRSARFPRIGRFSRWPLSGAGPCRDQRLNRPLRFDYANGNVKGFANLYECTKCLVFLCNQSTVFVLKLLNRKLLLRN
jgi:hypothetical protein